MSRIIPFKVQDLDGDKAVKAGALIRAIDVIGELENHLERAGALKAVYILFECKLAVAKEYPELFVPLRPSEGAS